MKRYSWYRILVINAHIGAAIEGGIISWCRQNLMRSANMIFFQEISLRHIPALKQALGPEWKVHFILSGTSGTNYIALKGDRFSLQERIDRDVRFGSKHGRSTRGVVVWDSVAKRMLLLTVIHPDPLGEGFVNANVIARGRHIKQVQNTTSTHESIEDQYDNLVHISAGDINESCDPNVYDKYPDELYKKSAPVLYSRAGMRGTAAGNKTKGPLHLMELFFKRFELRRALRVEAPEWTHMDHEVLAVWGRVEKGVK